jgi:hypothetical protein
MFPDCVAGRPVHRENGPGPSIVPIGTGDRSLCSLCACKLNLLVGQALDVIVPTTIFLDCGEFRSQAHLYGQARVLAPSTLGARAIFERPEDEVDVRLQLSSGQLV